MKHTPVLYIVIPCYNEGETLPVMAPVFLEKLSQLSEEGKISSESRILFVDDGSQDNTWELIEEFSSSEKRLKGISLSRNYGHQNALMAGMSEAMDECDAVITIDCDGQDDPGAMDEMLEKYAEGCDIVYGVRRDRGSDSGFKRNSARAYYSLMKKMGVNIEYDHADYRLVSRRVLKELKGYGEVNLFLRGIFPLTGFDSARVYYDRHERKAGSTHYSLGKMIAFALDGISSMSITPLRIIGAIGAAVSLLGLVGIIWAIVVFFLGHSVSGWASIVCIVCFLGGLQLLSLGVIGEYVGKTYLESKRRPRYIIKRRT